MSLPSLPVELLDNILQYTASAELVALSQTCSHISPVALRLLYRHIVISPWSRNINAVTTLAKRSDLAHFVRSFSITTAAFPPLFPAFYRLLASVLSSITEVTSLHLLIDSSASWVLEKIGDNVTYSRLQQFNCSFPLDSIVTEFLARTPALLQLEVDSLPCVPSSPIPTLPVATIPHLVQFIGSPRAARAIVPGRPLDNIQLSEGDLIEEDLACLAKGTADVLVLGATASTPPVPLLESIARHLPHLAYLRIMTTYHFTQAPEAGFMDRVANALSALPDLTAFELSGMHWGSSKRGDDGSKRIWQSTPLGSTFNPSDDVGVDPEIFLQY